jgi:DNA-directed RNA polymerase subunit RPC12/RpoP
MPKVKWLHTPCHSCGKELNSWDMRISHALGYKYIVCEECVAKEYGKDKQEVREIMEDFFGMRPCQGL